jgi:hypothetical protein
MLYVHNKRKNNKAQEVVILNVAVECTPTGHMHYTKCDILHMSIGHPRVTVTPPDRLLSPLELTVANSAPLAQAKKWPITAIELSEINRSQVRISGVEISIALTPAIEVTSVCLQICMEGILAVRSDKHTPLSEIVV